MLPAAYDQESLISDPLHGYIAFTASRAAGEIAEQSLIDHPWVQRLRRIHQLGISHLTYPGAEHSRLSHSLGVLHLVQEALSHLGTVIQDAQTDYGRHPLLAAALVHDVGHGPFSHVFEPCLDIHHEHWSCAVIRSPDRSRTVSRGTVASPPPP